MDGFSCRWPPSCGHCALLLAICLSAMAPFNAMAGKAIIEARWGGYVRAIGTRAYPDDQSIYQWVGSEALDDFQGELRLKNQTFASTSRSLEIHYELVAQQGDTRKKNNALRRILLPAVADRLVGPGPVSDRRRLMSLTRVIEESDDRVVYHRLDRLNLAQEAGWGTLRLGRQALTWGNGLIFNPMDLFNPFAPTSVLRDYKAGADMLHLQLPMDNGETQLLYVPGRDPRSGEVENDASSWAGKWHTAAAGLELDFMAARHFNDNLVGMGATGYLGGAAWRADAVYTLLHEDDERKDFLQVVANLDYAWQWGGRNVYGLVELYYNGLGRTGDYMAALTDPTLTARLERGEIFTLGRNYLSGRLQYEMHPLVQASAVAIVNLDDPSAIIRPQLVWDAATNLQVIAGATHHLGNEDTEYGGFQTSVTGTKITVVPADNLFLWLSYYF